MGKNSPCGEEELFIEDRLGIHKHLANNPNYFGTALDLDFKVIKPIKFNTNYEELTCIGLWPERNLLEATILVKLPFGFLGNMCSPGSHEYVRFFIDWDNDGDFADLNEDLGLASVNVHDVPQVREHPLCYAVRLPFRPFRSSCKDPYIVKLRAILSWEIIPTPGDWNFIPIWGNMLDCWVQVDPVEGKILAIAKDEVSKGAELEGDKGQQAQKENRIPKERAQFLSLIKENPNYFGTLAISDLEAINPLKCDTRYEKLKCIGLYPEENFLEAVLRVNLPYGFLGDLCSPGSYEYVRFFIDWDNDGDFMDFNEDIGVAAVNVHDIPEVRQFHLCYALGQRFKALRASCQRPYVVRARAILSWQQVPTGPNFVPVWGNIVECWIQIDPTDPTPDKLVAEITRPAPSTPPACGRAGPTAACNLAGVNIIGSAEGSGFASYRIEYRTLGSLDWIQDGVIYPDCSSASTTPDHLVPRSNEPLAFLINLEPYVYEVRLTVNGLGGPAFASTTFSLIRTPVVIDKIGEVDVRVIGLHPGDPSEPLKLVKLGAADDDPETSVGGSISLIGSADFFGCGRQMIEYVLQYIPAPCGLGRSPQGPPEAQPSPVPSCTAPPQEDTAIGWVDIKPPLPFGDANHPRWYYPCKAIDADDYTPNFVLNGKLNRVWHIGTCPSTLFPPLRRFYAHTDASPWDTSSLNGRFTVRLRVRHQGVGPVGELYDAATVWLDNRQINVKLAGLGISDGTDLGECKQLKLSQFVGKTMEIKGTAWDPLILDNERSWLKPNDNFDYYTVRFSKDSSDSYIPITTSISRVPNTVPSLPASPGDVGVLASWDIVNALDAGVPAPTPYVPPPYPKIYRGERCAYLLHLYARDKTYINDMGDIHDAEDYWPFCIVNDIK